MDNHIIIVDLETTGLQAKDRIIEICAIDFDSGARFHSIINPGIKITNSNIHGHTDKSVQGKPAFAVEGIRFMAWIETLGNVTIITHNSRFDQEKLLSEFRQAPELKRELEALRKIKFVCSIQLISSLYIMKSYKLSDICAQFGIAPGNHTAIDDSRALMEVLRKIGRGIVTEFIAGKTTAINAIFRKRVCELVDSHDDELLIAYISGGRIRKPQLLMIMDALQVRGFDPEVHSSDKKAEIISAIKSYLNPNQFAPESGTIELPNPSDEQRRIIDAVVADENVIVNAVAGSGKSTTVLWIAKQVATRGTSNRRIQDVVILTYNKHLQMEVTEKAREYGVRNLEVCTYHSFAGRNFTCGTVKDDISMNNVFTSELSKQYMQFDILVLDEVQDMKPEYYGMIHRFLSETQKRTNSNSKHQIVILGDDLQAVYEHLGADRRFLTLARNIYPGYVFRELELRTCYRCPSSVTQFVNKHMIKKELLIPNPGRTQSHKVLYYYGRPDKSGGKSTSKLLKKIVDKIMELRRTYKPEDIFILNMSARPSVGSFANDLSNELASRGEKIFMPLDDFKVADESVLRGKIQFASWHQSKGRERPVVVMLGFDNFSIRLAERNDPLGNMELCPSMHYVGVTRAKDILIVIQKGDCPKYADINPEIGTDYITFDCYKYKAPNYLPIQLDGSKVSVTSLVRHMKTDLLIRIQELMSRIIIIRSEKYMNLPIPVTSAQESTVEEIVDLNGVGIAAMYEKLRVGISNIELMVWQRESEIGKRLPGASKIADFLQFANLAYSIYNNVIYRSHQIQNYGWLDGINFAPCFELLDKHVSRSEVKFEVRCEAEIDLTKLGIRSLTKRASIIGMIDIVDSGNATIWEVKYTSDLTTEHQIQLILYSILYPKCNYKLVNLRTGQILELDQTRTAEIREIVELVLINKFAPNEKIGNAEFLEMCRIMRENPGSLIAKPVATASHAATKPATSDPNRMTKDELIKLCRDRGLKVTTKMRKDELIQALNK